MISNDEPFDTASLSRWKDDQISGAGDDLSYLLPGAKGDGR